LTPQRAEYCDETLPAGALPRGRDQKCQRVSSGRSQFYASGGRDVAL